jgi:uncharacterized membrane protein
MNPSTSTTVIEKLIDLELISKLRADLLRFKRKKEQQQNSTQQAA